MEVLLIGRFYEFIAEGGTGSKIEAMRRLRAEVPSIGV
jgi:hypothetical protein